MDEGRPNVALPGPARQDTAGTGGQRQPEAAENPDPIEQLVKEKLDALLESPPKSDKDTDQMFDEIEKRAREMGNG